MKKIFVLFLLLISCIFTHAQSSQKALTVFLDDSAVRTGFAGISIYDPSSKKYILQYNADKNFMPSSNVKLFTLYAGMKYLGDSIIGLKYMENDTAIQIFPTSDPTFLHPEFVSQPVFRFLASTKKRISMTDYSLFLTLGFGPGWSWDDYKEDFMAERSMLPIYGNTVSFQTVNSKLFAVPYLSTINLEREHVSIRPFDKSDVIARRDVYSNNFYALIGFPYNKKLKIPFITSFELSKKLLSDTLHKKIEDEDIMMPNDDSIINVYKIYSRPVDSLFRPMMFNSDNFFAEQTLLMVSNERLGFMSDQIMIDSLLKNDLKDIPNKPRWADGSGLSRYNLFSPNDFVYILQKTEKEFGWQRLKNILPTAGQGTLKGYYENLPGLIYAKTGSMSNNVSLSGFLFTKTGKKIIFSVIINNFSGSGPSGRLAIEKLILAIREIN